VRRFDVRLHVQWRRFLQLRDDRIGLQLLLPRDELSGRVGLTRRDQDRLTGAKAILIRSLPMSATKKPKPAQVRSSTKKAYEETDDHLKDLAVKALQESAGIEEIGHGWCRLNADKSSVVVGLADGYRAVFGVFGITEDRTIGAPQPFNLLNFKMTWRGKEDHPTEAQTFEDEAERIAWLDKHG
jgi:hypothetical protein